MSGFTRSYPAYSYETMLEACLEWLDNLEKAIGRDALVDSMPNGAPGRMQMRWRIGELETKRPEELDPEERRDVAEWLGEVAAQRQVQSRSRTLTRQERACLGLEVRQLLALIERLDASAIT